MKIMPYRELRSKEGLLPLFQHAFWWPFNPKEFEETIKADPRLTNSPVGFAAVKNKQIIGFVGVMDIATRTLQKVEEPVGGIWGVVTHPLHARKGIFKALMQRSHTYFEEQGYKFALLYTSRILIAYAFYVKLGYKDAVAYSSAYKIIRETGAHKKAKKKTKLDWDLILGLFNQTTTNCTGFVVKDKQYGTMLEKRKRIQPENSIVTAKGYALLRKDEGNIFIQELVAKTKEDASKLVAKIDKGTAKAVINGMVVNELILDTYRSAGYMIMSEGYGLLMSKQLANATFTETYGDKFYTSSADSF